MMRYVIESPARWGSTLIASGTVTAVLVLVMGGCSDSSTIGQEDASPPASQPDAAMTVDQQAPSPEPDQASPDVIVSPRVDAQADTGTPSTPSSPDATAEAAPEDAGPPDTSRPDTGSVDAGVQTPALDAMTTDVSASHDSAADGFAPTTGADSSTADAMDAAVAWQSICTCQDGTPIPYDYTFGMASEYAYAMFTDCNLSGYLMPLVEQDPEGLSAVAQYDADLTAWLRARVFGCDIGTEAVPSDFQLLPPAQSSDMSQGDFDTSVALFMDVVGRYDGKADGLTKKQKDEVRRRLKTFKRDVVKHEAMTPTKPAVSECIPSPPGEGDGG